MAHPSAAGLVRYLHELSVTTRAANQPDQELVQRFLTRRDEAALEALLRRHGPMVLRVCRRVLQQEQDAEDVFQATFLHFTRQAGSLRKQASVGSWLYGVAYNLARKAKAASARRRLREGKAAQRADSDPLAELTLREAQSVLDEELARLPDKLRAALVLCYLEGATRDEAAVQLGCSLATLKRRLNEGRELLRGRLARRGARLAGALLAVTLAEDHALAVVPIALRQATLLAACHFADGAPLIELVSPGVVQVMQFAARETLLLRLHWGFALLLALGLGGGAGLYFRNGGADLGPGPSDSPRLAEAERAGELLPGGALARLGGARLAHGGVITSVAFAADGRTLVSAGQDGTVRWWDAATGKQLRLFGEGDPRRQAFLDTHGVACAAISLDGGYVAGGEARRRDDRPSVVHIWETATGQEIASLAGPGGGVWAVAFGPDGRSLASAGEDGQVRLWDVRTKQQVRRLVGHRGPVRSLAFSGNGRRLTTGGHDGDARLWDVRTGAEIARPLTHPQPITCLALTRDGKTLISACQDQIVRIWDTDAAQERVKLAQPEAVLAVALSADGRSLAFGSSTRLTLWDMAGQRTLRQLPGLHANVQALALSDDGTALACVPVGSNAIHLWDVGSRAERAAPTGHAGQVGFLQFSPDGQRLLSAANDGRLCRWPADGTRPERRFDGQQTSARACAATADGRTLVTGGADGGVRLFDAATGRERSRFSAHNHAIAGVAVAPDGSVIATATEDGAVALWSATGKQLFGDLAEKRPPAPVAFLRFSPDGRRLAVAERSQIVLWDVASGQAVRRFREPEQVLCSGVFSSEGTLFAAGTEDGKALVWDVVSARKTRTLSGHAGVVTSVAFSPDGRSLAAGSWRSVRIWELASAEPREGFTGIDGDVSSTAFSPDGMTLATGHADTSILLWDMTGLRPPGRQPPPALKAAQVQAAWNDLAAGDPVQAHRAVWAMAAAPHFALPILREGLFRAGSDEARFPPAERLRQRRGMEVLEKISGAEADELLRELARGADQDPLVLEARAALRRRAKPAALPRLESLFKNPIFDQWRAALQEKVQQLTRPMPPPDLTLDPPVDLSDAVDPTKQR